MKEKVVRNRDKEKGAILVVATIVVIAMLIMATPFLFKLSGQQRSTERANKALAAINLAEAGCDRAVWELNHGLVLSWVTVNNRLSKTYSDFKTSSGTTVGDISIEILPLTGTPPAVELRTVVGEGEVGFIKPNNNVYRKIQVNLERRYNTDLRFALFADEGIDAAALTLVDSYDSRDLIEADRFPPLYNPADALDKATYQTANGNIGSNDHIMIAGNSGVYGNASVYLPDNEIPELNSITEVISQAITGTNYHPPTESQVIPGEYIPKQNIVPPELQGGSLGDYNYTPKLTTGNYVYDSFSIPENKTLTIEGQVNIYIKYDLNFGTKSVLNVLAPSKWDDPSTYNRLTIYLGGNMDMPSNSSLNNNASMLPSNLSILGLDTCNSINMSSNIDFFGVIDARNANIVYGSGGAGGGNEFYGSIVCNSIELNSNTGFHYDEALGSTSTTSSGIPYYVVVAWQEKPI